MSRESFRCYIEGTGNRWKSYCAEVDLGAYGSTPGEARLALERLLERYCHERDEGTPAAQAVRRAAGAAPSGLLAGLAAQRLPPGGCVLCFPHPAADAGRSRVSIEPGALPGFATGSALGGPARNT